MCPKTELKLQKLYNNKKIKGDITMDKKVSKFTIKAEKELLKKFEYISKQKGHSIDEEVEMKMKEKVEEFEKEHGEIETND